MPKHSTKTEHHIEFLNVKPGGTYVKKPLGFKRFKPCCLIYSSVSQPPGRGPVPGPGINYTGPREVVLEFVILVF